jgi:hypothetical protein
VTLNWPDSGIALRLKLIDHTPRRIISPASHSGTPCGALVGIKPLAFQARFPPSPHRLLANFAIWQVNTLEDALVASASCGGTAVAARQPHLPEQASMALL